MAGKKILIVDDEEDVLAVLESRLSLGGYLVIKADNGREAIRLAKAEQPNLVLLDIAMPGMDGAEVAEILKSDPQAKDIPIVFLTCLFTKDEEAMQGHKRGGVFFIAKPYDPEKLLSEIEERLAK